MLLDMIQIHTNGNLNYGCDWARTVRPHRRGGLNHYKGHEIVSGPRHGGRPDFKTFYIVISATNCPCRCSLNSLPHFEVFCNSCNGHVKCFDIYRVLARSCPFLLRTMHINHSHFQKIRFEFSLIESRCSGTPSIPPRTIDWHGISLLAADLQTFCETPVPETISHAWNHVSNFQSQNPDVRNLE